MARRLMVRLGRAAGGTITKPGHTGSPEATVPHAAGPLHTPSQMSQARQAGQRDHGGERSRASAPQNSAPLGRERGDNVNVNTT